MDLVEGIELIDFLNASKRQADPVVRYIFLELGRILNLMHQAGIAHRDLKPENVMVTRDLQLKVIDLGYGVKHEGTEKQGFSKTRLGTPMYMAPEIESGKPYQGADADVFAFGTMLFVSKCIAYPWERATKTDVDYVAISSDKGSNEQFWQKYQGSVPTLTNEFKDVVNSAVQRVPTRATLVDVLGFPWMKGETMTKE